MTAAEQLYALYLDAKREAQALDRAYFARNPDVHWRVRPALAHEDHAHRIAEGGPVLVSRQGARHHGFVTRADVVRHFGHAQEQAQHVWNHGRVGDRGPLPADVQGLYSALFGELWPEPVAP